MRALGLVALLLAELGCGRVHYDALANEDADVADPADARQALPPNSQAWLEFLQGHGQLMGATSLDEWATSTVTLEGIDAATFPKASFGIPAIHHIYFIDIPNLEDLAFLEGVTNLIGDSRITGPDLVSLFGVESLETLGTGADIAFTNTGTEAMSISGLTNLEFVPWGAGLWIAGGAAQPTGGETLSLLKLATPAGTSCLDTGPLVVSNHRASKLLLATTGMAGQVYIASGPLSDISGIQGGSVLCALGLPDNQISDVSSLATITVLESLGLAGNPLGDISPLGGASLASTLLSLDISRTQVSDISVLSGFPQLVELNLSQSLVDDLGPIASLTNLKILSLSGRAINQTNLNLLGGLSLEQIAGDFNVAGQGVTSLAPLAGITGLGTRATESSVDFSDNNLTNLTGLESVIQMGQFVDFRGNPALVEVGGLTNLQRLNGSGTLHVPDNLSDIRGLANFVGEVSSPDTLFWSSAPSVTNKASAQSALCLAIDSGAVLLSGAQKSDICLP